MNVKEKVNEWIDNNQNEVIELLQELIRKPSVNAYFDEQDHDRVDVGIEKSGNGKYITNGKAINITWKSDGLGYATHYYDVDGNELQLNQGKTWINIMDKSHATDNMIYSTVKDYEASKKQVVAEY